MRILNWMPVGNILPWLMILECCRLSLLGASLASLIFILSGYLLAEGATHISLSHRPVRRMAALRMQVLWKNQTSIPQVVFMPDQ